MAKPDMFSRPLVRCKNCNAIIPTLHPPCPSCGEDPSVSPFDEKKPKPEEEPVRCPRCSSTQVSAQKKGFGLGKAVGGALLLGPIGLLGGAIGRNAVEIICMKCGHRWRP